MQKTSPLIENSSDLSDPKKTDSLEQISTAASGLEKPSFVIGIGASAGGLDSLEKFFRNMPNNTELAFVVVQHLSPDYKSMMVELLAKHTRMPIRQAEDGMLVQPNTVYLIPPKAYLTIDGCKLWLATRSNQTHALHLPIDIFFRSLAEDLEGHAIGIVLSGTGSDGTLGSRSIKEAGGMLMVQDPASAQFDGMPNSAIHTGLADYVLPPEEMPGSLLKYVKHPLSSQGDLLPASSQDEGTLMKILGLVRGETGVDFSYYKLSTVVRRIERRMGINQIEKAEHYQRYLQKNPDEIRVLYSELLIGVTRFFRDNEAFEVIQEQVIPSLMESHVNTRSPLRVWVAGCSSGEEVYSLAILFNEYLEKQGIHIDVKIFATDIDHHAVETAALGRYPASIVSDVPMPLLGKYFYKADDNYQVVEKIRKMIIFAQHNLLKDPPFNNLDLVSCRNLLIYLQNDMQHKVLSMFAFSLRENGVLFLGSSEAVGNLADFFTPIDSKWRLYRYNGGASFLDFRSFELNRSPNEERLPSYPMLHRSPTPRDSNNTVIQRIQNHLLDLHLAPTVVLDQDLNLIHTVGEVNDFLHIPKGQISTNIFKLLDENLTSFVSNAIRESQTSKQLVRLKDIHIPKQDQHLVFTLLVDFFFDEYTKRRFFLLTFYGADRVSTVSQFARDIAIDNIRDLRVQELEHELQLTRENLQATIEELETANEELQATNEELMSANEELQSTNEELQSVNEELFTLNSQYQNKIEELTNLNNDMDNLLSSTHIGTMFLDLSLRIRKFTPAIREQFPLIDHDVGRPIHHFSRNFDYPNLIDDLHQVMESLIIRERDVRLEDGTVHQVRILPYRTTNNTIDGLVLTFVDITQRVEVEKQLRTTQERFEVAVEGSSDGLWDWSNVHGDAMWWSPRFHRLLGYEPGSLPSQLSTFKNMLHEQDRPLFSQAIEEHFKNKRIFDVQYRIHTYANSYRWFRIRGQAHRNEDDQVIRMAGSISDIHDHVEVQRVLTEKERLYRILMEMSPHRIWITDTQGRGGYINHSNIDSLEPDQPLLQVWTQKIHPKDADQVIQGWQKALQENSQFSCSVRFNWDGHGYTDCRLLGGPIRDGQQEVIGWAGIDTYSGANSSYGFPTGDPSVVEGALFRALYEQAPLGIALNELDGHYIMINQALMDMLGYNEKDLQKIRVLDITPTEYHEEEDRQLRYLMEMGQYGPYHKEYICRDGQRLAVSLQGVLYRCPDGSSYIWSFVQRCSTAH